MNKTIILTTGGTGGHIFPARTIAQELSRQGFRVIIFGDKNYARYHKKTDEFSFKIISSSKLSKSPLELFKAAVKIKIGVMQSLWLLITYHPQTVVAFGGYSTFPVLLASILLRKRIILHEQNAHLGKVNRLFARFADKIVLSYKDTDGVNENLKNKTIFTGNPIRTDILALGEKEYQLPNMTPEIEVVDNLGYDVLLASQFYNNEKNIKAETFNILVIGGSGGARIFSDILPKAFFNLRDELKNHIHITQQCRLEDVPATFEKYKSLNLGITISHFFEDMAEEISKAHLIIARSGSSSIAEFTCARRPMILVPFAKAADNHQEKNALAISNSGGAIVIKEQDFTINVVTATLEKLIDNPGQLKKMADSAFGCANLNAGKNLIKVIEDES